MESNPGKSLTWECSYCETKGLQETRNCDAITAGYCKEHGSFEFENLIEDEENGKLKCPVCEKAVQMPFQLKLGKRYWIWGCPIQHVNYADVNLIKFVNWSEAMRMPPSGKSLYDESNLYFEIRDFVLREQNEAKSEFEELKPHRDQRASDVPKQGSRPRMAPSKLPRRR